MKVIGLDISKQSTGVAIGDASGPPRNLRARIEGTSIGAVAYNFRRWFRELCILERPDFVSIEAAFVGPTDDAYTATMMLGMNFEAQGVCHGRQIGCATVAVSTWRKMFLGHGRPENPKREAIRMCKTLGWDVDGNHDRAEACGIWSYGHFTNGDRKAIMRQLSVGSVRSMAQ